ncbi:hypothetical protein LXL04_001539 [Taraxacum kok-saghyz]
MKEHILLDLNEESVEENSMNAQHENNAIEEQSQNNIANFEEPFVVYARKNGFSVRKGRFVNKKTGEKKIRDFFCHREGKSELKKDYTKVPRNRGYTRCECKAHMHITLRRINEIFPEEWQVTKFVTEHNHTLLSTQEVRFLPSYRNITLEDEKRILLLKEGGLSVTQIMRVMELERNVRHGELSFLKKDVHNLFTKNHKLQSENDAKEILEYCQSAKNSENRLEHIFWCPAHCFELYQKYGDVVVFDTTYKVDLAIEDVGHKQMHDSMLAKYQDSHLRSLSPLEKQGYQVLTPFAFKKFQDQFAQAIQYSTHEEKDTSFIVKHYKATRCHQVVWDGKMAKCTCKNFEFVGILCRHILCVLLHKGCFDIPSSYWLSRWSRQETQFNEIPQLHEEGNFDVTSYRENNTDIVTNAIELVQCPIISKTKGRPKQK